MGAFESEDLLAGSTTDFSHHFDPGEFRARERLESEHFWHVHRRGLILDFVRRALPAGGRLIELGCGTGAVATWLNRHGYRVDYGDVHAEGLAAARRRAERELTPNADDPLRFVRLDVTAQFPSGDYDGALYCDVLEHLDDPAPVLRLAREHLRPDALVLFTVPAFRLLWSPWDDVQHHRRRYTPAEARALAERCGLRVERATCFFGPLFFAAGAVKLARRARDLLRDPAPPAAFDRLLEARSTPALNRALVRGLSLERRWLRGRDLPCGTSVVCVCRV